MGSSESGREENIHAVGDGLGRDTAKGGAGTWVEEKGLVEAGEAQVPRRQRRRGLVVFFKGKGTGRDRLVRTRRMGSLRPMANRPFRCRNSLTCGTLVIKKSWKMLWKTQVPAKIRMFLWRLSKHSIPTEDVRAHRHMTNSSS